MNKAMMTAGVILFLVGSIYIIDSNKSDAQIALEVSTYQLDEILDDLSNSLRGNSGYRTSDYEARAMIEEEMFQSRVIGLISLIAGIFLFFIGYKNQKTE
ncbi:hypothetical protein OAC45_05685 [Gammaproteobacteria bacterium]|jgi:uncharacterized membrane protein YiaA|nr:hypothetical protein [Gammaproteobacteria bacterium]